MSEQPGEPAALAEQELLRLWRVAREMAYRLCGRSLARLRAGQGGFYATEDFEQDLFLEFWDLARRWWAEKDHPDEGRLWAAWRRRLWGGGLRVLRRAPQRLWQGEEQAVDPLAWALDDGGSTGGSACQAAEAHGQLPAEARAALVQADAAETTRAEAERLTRLEAALARLRPAQRQILYLTTLSGLSGAETARSLELADRDVVYQRVHAARAALRRALKVRPDL